ncbi:MAG: AarF/ABC1/UbiB kinase family protein [Verrucomicrobiae bacterium]|nr:AarF/ABC1/UbiB kinase family protein [Verrucomicrobiae bacterium]
MNWISFIGLLRDIYGPSLPPLERFERRGLLAVKIGQTFALRIDFLGEAKCRHLAQLYRRTTPIPAEDVEALIDRHCPPNWRRHFLRIEPRPLAAASVGQVHRAVLRDGQEVVVKMIKGDFKERFKADVRRLKKLMRLSTWAYPKLRRVADPVGILEHIEEYTLAELDLRNEISHARRLRQLREQHAHWPLLAPLRFPHLYEELSGENVLVMEYLHGRTLDELLAVGELPYEELLKLFLVHGAYMFGLGVFHGDLHPGNIIWQDGHLYFVDTGALSEVSDTFRLGLFAFFEALAGEDYVGAACAIHRMSRRALPAAQWEAYLRQFLDLYRDFADKTVSEVSLTRQMMRTIQLAVHSGMEFERGMYPIIKSLMYLDGMVLKCNPKAVLMRDMRPHLATFKRLFATMERPSRPSPQPPVRLAV